MHGRAAKLTQQKGAVALLATSRLFLTESASWPRMLSWYVVQNRGPEAFTDCPWREILLNAANAKPFMELGSYLRSPGPGGHNIRRSQRPQVGASNDSGLLTSS